MVGVLYALLVVERPETRLRLVMSALGTVVELVLAQSARREIRRATVRFGRCVGTGILLAALVAGTWLILRI